MPLTDVQHDVTEVLARVGQQVSRGLAAALAQEGSTPDEWRVLALLHRAGGQSMSALADATMLPAPTLTKRVDRMVADNLVHRRIDETDRRRVLVLLTPRGRAHHERLAARVEAERKLVADAAAGAGVALPELVRLLAALGDALDAGRR